MDILESKKTILIIEDEADIRQLYTEYLTDSGFEVLEASDGNEGLSKALSESWDLLLLDIMLPGRDGVQVLKLIKENERLRNKPIVLLTNLSMEAVIGEAFSLGADSYLIKSEITPDKIVNEINAALTKRS